MCRHVLTQVNNYYLNSYLNRAYPYHKLQSCRDPAFVHTLACHQTPESKAWYRGSGDALRNALPHIRFASQGMEDPEEFLVISGQDVYHLDFRKLVAYHRASKADVTVVTQEHAFQGAHAMGVCQVNPQSRRIEQFVERPSVSQMRRMVSADNKLDVSLGMYVFKRKALERLLEEERGEDMAHMGADVVPYAVGMGMHVVAFNHAGSYHCLLYTSPSPRD